MCLQAPGWRVVAGGFPTARIVGLDAAQHLPLLLVASEDGWVRVWDWMRHTQLAARHTGDRTPLCCSLHPSGLLAAVGTNDTTLAVFWVLKVGADTLKKIVRLAVRDVCYKPYQAPACQRCETIAATVSACGSAHCLHVQICARHLRCCFRAHYHLWLSSQLPSATWCATATQGACWLLLAAATPSLCTQPTTATRVLLGGPGAAGCLGTATLQRQQQVAAAAAQC